MAALVELHSDKYHLDRSMTKETIRALLFDVFGTVVDWRGSIAEEVRQIPQLANIDGYEFTDRWRAKYQPAMEKVRSGNRPWVKLDTLHYENLLELLGEFGVNSLSDEFIAHLNFAWHRLTPWEDSVEGLQRLKSQYIVATLSNGNVSLIVDMAKNAGLPWDMVLGAEVVQHYKPEPEAYLKSAQMLDLQPSQCMLVAAHNSDLVAASKCGYQTAFVVRPTEHGPNQKTDLFAESQFDYVASSFVDLSEQLGC